MKKLLIGAIALSLLAGSAAVAQPNGRGHDQGHGNQSNNGQHAGWGRDYGSNHHWRRGQRVGYNDWNSAPVVDYRQHHLRQPPRGYEWRESNGQYILAAVATGLIASIIINAGR